MKQALFAFACALVLARDTCAQKAADAQADANAFQLGARTVKIPPPEGFTNVFSDRVAGRFTAIEDSANEALSVHVPDGMVARLKASPDMDLTLYSKVSVFKALKTVDTTPEMFAELATSVEKSVGDYLDPNGATVKRAKENSETGLSEYLGTKTKVELTGPKNLGFFDKQSNVLSDLILMNVDISGTKYTILFTVSYLNVNSRLIYVYTYKVLTGANDDEMLRALTKKWTTAILAANK